MSVSVTSVTTIILLTIVCLVILLVTFSFLLSLKKKKRVKSLKKKQTQTGKTGLASAKVNSYFKRKRDVSLSSGYELDPQVSSSDQSVRGTGEPDTFGKTTGEPMQDEEASGFPNKPLKIEIIKSLKNENGFSRDYYRDKTGEKK